jgi:hypothetical protein
MSSTAISTLNTDYFQIAFSSTSSYQSSSSANNGIGSYGNSFNAFAAYAQGSDSGQLSAFAQLVSTLQQVQQQDPTQYQQLTQQIALNLQGAAQTAQTDGNAPQANQLSQLASDFTNASGSGQLPNLQDLAQAVGGPQTLSFNESITSSSFSSGNSTPAATTSNSNSANGPFAELKKLLESFLTSLTQDQSQSLNPLSIIQNALSNAGINDSNS